MQSEEVLYGSWNLRVLLLNSLSVKRASGSSRSCCSQYQTVFLTVEKEIICVLSHNALANFRELILSNKLDQLSCLLGNLYWAKERSRERAIKACFFTKLFIFMIALCCLYVMTLSLVNWLIYTVDMPYRPCSLTLQGGSWLEQTTAHF